MVASDAKDERARTSVEASAPAHTEPSETQHNTENPDTDEDNEVVESQELTELLNRDYNYDEDDEIPQDTAFSSAPKIEISKELSESQAQDSTTSTPPEPINPRKTTAKPKPIQDADVPADALEHLRPFQTQRSTSTTTVQVQPTAVELNMSVGPSENRVTESRRGSNSATSPASLPNVEHSSEVATMLNEVLDSDNRIPDTTTNSEPLEYENNESLYSSSSSVMSFYNDIEETDEQNERETFLTQKKHYFILSSAGKPIYSMNGSDELITGYMGIFQAIVSYFDSIADDAHADGQEGEVRKAGREQLKNVKAGNALFVFAVEDPLILIAVDKLGQSEHQLRAQLDVLNAQILSTLTKSQLAKVFRTQTNYDLRQLIGGTEVFLNALTREMSIGSPGILLGSLECLFLRKSVRNKINNVLIERRTKSLLYGMIIADSRLVSVIRPRRHSLHPPDLHLVFSMLFNTTSFSKGGEHWVPICLPKFNSTGFLYAYIYFFIPECAIVLISPDKNSFFEMRECKEHILEDLQGSNLISPITHSLTRGRFKTSDIPGASVIRHFLYKSKTNVQFVMPMYNTGDEDVQSRHKLMVLYHQLHGAVHNKFGHFKVYHTTRQGLTGLAWATRGFELYCITGGNGVTKEAVSSAVRAIVSWIKQDEERLFVIGGAVF